MQAEALVRDLGAFARFLKAVSALRLVGPLDQPPLDQLEEIEGISLEGLVARHLRARIAYRNSGERLYFWRMKFESEVDFFAYGNDYFCAWQVKRTTSVHSVGLRSLKSVRQDYPEVEVTCCT